MQFTLRRTHLARAPSVHGRLLTAVLIALGGGLACRGAAQVAAATAENDRPPAVQEAEVRVVHSDGHTFGGRLVLPATPGPHPVAVLVSPPGEHPRDELRDGGEHWTVLAGNLAQVGVGSLRVDNRGVLESRSDDRPAWSNTWTLDDLASDLRGHVDWLIEQDGVDTNRVGLVAHGDGALIAGQVAAEDRGLAFAVFLSVHGGEGAAMLADSLVADVDMAATDVDALRSEATAALRALSAGGANTSTTEAISHVLEATGLSPSDAESQASGFTGVFDNALYRSWLIADPVELVRVIEVPLLVLNGAGDEKIDARGSADALASALVAAGAFSSRVDLLPDLGHFLESHEAKHLAAEVTRRTIAWIANSTGLSRESLLPSAKHAAPPFWVRDVHVVDVRLGKTTGRVDVEIRDAKIVSIAASTSHVRGPTDVDGAGKFLVPGLWDCHGHLTFWGGDALARLAASGVTTVRDMGGDWSQIRRWRSQIKRGTLFGPRVLASGPFLDGPKPNFQWRLFARDGAEGADAVRHLESTGVDFVKVHSRLPRSALDGAAAAARDVGLRLAGHAPRGVAPQELAGFGFVSLEHVDSLLSALAFAEPRQVESWTEAYSWWRSAPGEEAMRDFAAGGLRVTPTLSAFRALSPRIPPSFAAIEPWLHDLTRRLHEQGVTILAGSDFSRRSMGQEPGASLVAELVLLTEAGLSPLDALRAATLHPAVAMGREDLGVVEVDAVADLVLVAANPLEDIRSLEALHGLCLRGVWYSGEDLAALRRRAQSASSLIDETNTALCCPERALEGMTTK